MRKRREIPLFSISFLDLLSGALGAVIILYVAIPKNQTVPEPGPAFDKTILEQQLESRQREIQSLEELLVKAKEKLNTLEKAVETSKAEPSKESFDVGFKFKGKKIVFIIDTSFSMTEEDRMAQVKAGLKMLLTAMGPSYEVEVIQFPNGTRTPFRTLWGAVKSANLEYKAEALDFIYSLRPEGGTPTRDVLRFTLKNYPDVTDIVLLTDGAPSLHNSNKKDNIHDILTLIRGENHQRIQINAIGVGSNFIHDKTSEQFQFLSLIAEQNNGFFVGF